MHEHVRAIKDVEHKADLLTATVNQRIDKSFITPIDREDIHMRTRLDDVIDLIVTAPLGARDAAHHEVLPARS